MSDDGFRASGPGAQRTVQLLPIPIEAVKIQLHDSIDRVVAFVGQLPFEKFVTPRFALAFGTFIDGVADTETVVTAIASGAGGKLSALGASVEVSGLGGTMFLVKLELAYHAHR